MEGNLQLALICIGAALSIGLAGLGTHTFSKKLGILTPIPQYEALEESVGILAHTQVTFGHHVHVGVQSGDEVVAIINHLLPYVPVIVAISANSPFWRGYDTGHSAYRHRILASSRSYGIPPVFEDWNACSDFIDHTMLLEIYKSVNDIHWDIRPRPRFGTVEVRLMDSQPTLEETNDITAFVYTLIIDIARHIEHGTTDQLLPMPHPWIQKENHFQAARVGIDAKYIGQSVDQLQSLKEITLSTMEQLEPISSKIGAESNIQNIRDRIQQGTLPYQRQKSIYADGGTKKIIKEMLL